jgi:pyruvate dehydrogenase E2 component (dihydrolipoamide acetyltransferase)
MYEIVMPQLSDSMDEGKLISWKVKVGDSVSVGQVIAEVESDKAIMEVQAFKNGVVKELLLDEDEEAPVGTVIARIDTGVSVSQTAEVAEQEPQKLEEKAVQKEEPVKKEALKVETQQILSNAAVAHKSKNVQKGISPKARAKAAAYGVELDALLAKINKEIVHVEDVDEFMQEKYFTVKALKLLQTYHLETTVFELNHKIDSEEVQAYIDAHELPLPQPLSAMQKAIISNVTASAQKPVFHLYEHLDAALFEKHSEHSITMWLVRIFAKVMMQHEAFRSRLKNETLLVMPNAAISVAVADEKDLYMPVVHDANRLSMAEVAEVFEDFKNKLKSKTFTAEDMKGSSFGISNLGMLGVERFDAMINKDDAAIVAVGAIQDGKIAVTLTADHRLINGYEAALFMRDIKKEAQDPLNFKE